MTEAAVRSGLRGFKEDFDLTRQQGLRTVLPIELLNNFRLLNQARREYLDAIVEYNRAQFELYVALGQPPADSAGARRPGRGDRAGQHHRWRVPDPDRCPAGGGHAARPGRFSTGVGGHGMAGPRNPSGVRR